MISVVIFKRHIDFKFMRLFCLQIEHYLQIVKTEVITGGSHKLVEEYEYTAHSSLVQSIDIPVAKFHFELSPMQVSNKRCSII